MVSMIHAGGGYGDYTPNLSNDEKSYLKYFIDTQTFRVDQAKEIFPNHYEFLEDWYKKWNV